MTIQKGDILGEVYQIVKKVGAGSFGTVYLAEHTNTKKLYAIKTEP